MIESKGTCGWGPYFPYLITWRNLRWLNWMKTGWIPWNSTVIPTDSHFQVDLWSHCRFTKRLFLNPTLPRARKTPSVLEDFWVVKTLGFKWSRPTNREGSQHAWPAWSMHWIVNQLFNQQTMIQATGNIPVKKLRAPENCGLNRKVPAIWIDSYTGYIYIYTDIYKIHHKST